MSANPEPRQKQWGILNNEANIKSTDTGRLDWLTFSMSLIEILLTVKVKATILMQYPFCQIQVNVPHGHLAARSVCALKKQASVCTVLAL